jgi:hypothetical protein
MSALWIRRLCILAWLLAVAIECRSAEVPRSYPIAGQLPSNTILEAVHDGLIACADRSVIAECGGAVFKRNNIFYYTQPVMAQSDRELGEYRIGIPRDAQLVAIFHTHPESLTNDASNGFSAADVETAKRLNVASYVGVLKTGNIIIFVPGIDKSHSGTDTANLGNQIAYGRVAGNIR